MLRLRETMDFIYKENRRHRAEKLSALGLCDDFAHFFHTAGHGTERKEGGFELSGHNFGQSGLAYARRSPKNERGDAAAFDHIAQNCARSHEMPLLHVGVERKRPQTFCQWFHIWSET